MGEFANKHWVVALSWIVASIIVALNVKLVIDKVGEALSNSPSLLLRFGISLGAALLFILLAYITIKPFVDRTIRGQKRKSIYTMLEEGAPMIAFGQGFGSMNAPMKELERALETVYSDNSTAPKYAGKEEIDEIRIIASWIYQHRNDGVFLYMQQKTLPDVLEELAELLYKTLSTPQVYVAVEEEFA
jgi:hypothetical protein